MVGGVRPLVSSSHLSGEAGSISLVLPLHRQQGALPLLGLLQLPVQIQNAVLQLLQQRDRCGETVLFGVRVLS